ncbi:MAG: anion transporter [Caenispirillum sp.]|nr:anion transporter [Caenispirillum sp.]
MTLLVVAVFVLTYLGMAAGRWPGLAVDRTGIALLGALVVVLAGAVPAAEVQAAVDWPTLVILFGLMILSAQAAQAGLYDWCARRIAVAEAAPERLLALLVVTAGGLSMVLANDVVVFAMTPMLCAGLTGRGLDARPFLIGLAGAANAGSAATLIGNPQNILIGQVGGLDFWAFAAACGVPALIGLACVHLVVSRLWRGRWHLAQAGALPPVPEVDRPALWKAGAAALLLLGLFSAPLPHTTGVLLVAGLLLVSRRMATRTMLGMVDWHLLVLFAGLFVVTKALALTGLPAQGVAALAEAGLVPDRLSVLLPLSLVGSNTIGNVPLVMLLLAVWPDLAPGTLYGLAALSTLAGNLLVVGSLANIITVERARAAGVTLSFADHARCGVPMTLLSLAGAALWLWLAGYLAI